MDVQSFLASGLLEAYALNQCSAEERATVESMLQQHPSLREELNRIELALEQYARANAVPPPAGLRSKVLEEIARETNPASRTEQRFTRNLILGAAISAAIVMGILWQGSQRGYRLLEIENQRIQKEMEDCQARQKEYIAMEGLLNLLRDPGTKVITISGKNQQTSVYYNDSRQAVALDLSRMPQPEPGKYLQFWAIVEGDAAPKSMGMVSTQGDWQNFAYVPNAVGFAVSEEPTPDGSAVPTTVVMAPI
jgi:anti-sigma-K factor RskA